MSSFFTGTVKVAVLCGISFEHSHAACLLVCLIIELSHQIELQRILSKQISSLKYVVVAL